MASHNPSLAQGRDLSNQRIDPQVLSGKHEWNLEPVRGLSFRETVEQASDPRKDMTHFKLIAAVDKQKAMNLFAGLANSSTLFKLPFTLRCDCTFARDSEEAIYLDAMDVFIEAPAGQFHTPADIPILQRSLQNRMFSAFARKPGYLRELFERRRFQIWLPSDAPENKELGDAVLSGLYPKTEPWLDQIYQPPGLPVPLPFVIFYFHSELRNAQLNPELGNSEHIRRLRVCLQMEYYVLFMTTWWNESYHGGKMYVLNDSTIQILEHYCGSISDIAGKPAQVIIEHMRIASQLPQKWHNWMCYRGNSMEPSVFIWSRRGYGGLDPNEESGVRLFCDILRRKITFRRYESNIFKRLSVMEQRLSDPDLDQIEGLLGLVRDHAWDTHSSLRVSDILYHMLSLYRRTHQRAGEAMRDNDTIRRELDLARQDLEERTCQLRGREDRLDDLFRRLDDRESYIDELRSRIADLERESSKLREEMNAALRNDQSRSVRRKYNDAYDNNNYQEQPESESRHGTPHSPEYNPPTRAPSTSHHNRETSTVRPPQHCSPGRKVSGQVNFAPILSRSQHVTQSRIASRANVPPAALPNVNGTDGSAPVNVAGDNAPSRPGTPRSGRQYPFHKTLKDGKAPGSACANFRKTKMASANDRGQHTKPGQSKISGDNCRKGSRSGDSRK